MSFATRSVTAIDRNTILARIAPILVGSAFGAVTPFLPLMAAASILVAVIGLLFIALGYRKLSASVSLPNYASLVLASAAIVTVTMNGLRVSSWATYSDMIFVIGGLTVAATAFSKSRVPISVPTWLSVPAVLIVSAGVIASVRDGDGLAGFLPVLQFSGALVMVPVLVANAVARSRRLSLLLSCWLLSSAVSGATAAGSALGLTSIGSQFGDMVFGDRAAGLTVHPSHLGLTCAMTIPVGMGLIATTGDTSRRVTLLALTAAATAGVLASGSRAGLMGAIGGALLFTLLASRLSPSRIVATTVALVGIPWAAVRWSLVPEQLLVGVNRLTGSTSTSTSNAARLELYQDAWTRFADNPLVGEGFSIIREAHNIYLQLLQAGGLVALVGFVVFAVFCLRTGAVATSSEVLSDRERILAAAVLSSFCVWLMIGTIHNQIYDRYLYVPSGFLLGIELLRQRAATVPPRVHRFIPMSRSSARRRLSGGTEVAAR